ncbi:cytochrome c biogenesis CcdA family protein [bacterium]
MVEHITHYLQQVSLEPLGLLLALVLGAVSAVTSVCCTLPAIAILIGYSGAKKETDRKVIIMSSLFFTFGIVLALMIIGGVAGFVGQVAQNVLGRYWKVFAGITAIIFGLATLKMLPFNISFGKIEKKISSFDKLGILVTGLIMGGIIAVSSLPCNPGIFIVLAAAMLQGKIVWAIVLLTMFALGFSLPLGAVLLGISFSKMKFVGKNTDAIVRWIAGIILIAAGFYFLLKF